MSPIYYILLGWEEFQSVHIPASYGIPALRMFGLFMCTQTTCKSTRPAKTEIAEALDDVAKTIRRDCVRFGIPLWPAIIPNQPEHAAAA